MSKQQQYWGFLEIKCLLGQSWIKGIMIILAHGQVKCQLTQFEGGQMTAVLVAEFLPPPRHSVRGADQSPGVIIMTMTRITNRASKESSRSLKL